jgi:ketol-acid reductoisomerase
MWDAAIRRFGSSGKLKGRLVNLELRTPNPEHMQPSTRVFYDRDADQTALAHETVAVLGYGIQGRAQALTLRDSSVNVIVGNRRDEYRDRADADGIAVFDISDAVQRATIVLLLLPDETQAAVFDRDMRQGLTPGKAVVFAHGLAIRYRLIVPPDDVDCMLLAPRLPGHYLRERFLAGWGVPAFVSVAHDATGGAWKRVLALAHALGITRCGAMEVSFADETELDHFSEHFTYPLIFHALEIAFDVLVEAGYPPEAALMELHGSGELGSVLQAASREGLYGMIASHASPACQVGIANHWASSTGPVADVRRRAEAVLDAIRDGRFVQHLGAEQSRGYPELRAWRAARSSTLEQTEQQLRTILHGPPKASDPKHG